LILLDTHAFVWLADDPGRLSEAARQAIAEDAEAAISAISAYEVAYLALRGRLEFDLPVGAWVREAIGAHGMRVIPLTTAIALRAGSLDRDSFPGDPADRIIYATALERGARLVSRDTDITEFDPARVLW
jgi:PIN domain nuclease of toxin-antitoxin system